MENTRLIIKRIRLENFKSYYGVHEIGNFHPNFSSVIGPNGSGKSNLIDSMVFIFGKRASWMRLKHLRELIHNSAKYGQCKKAQVSVVFTELDPNNDEVPRSEFTITRYITLNDESGYKVNDVKTTLAEVTNLLKSKGVDLDNNRFMILQGEVEQISLMKPKTGNPDLPGFLEYLEEIIGTSIYVEEIDTMQKQYDESLSNRLEKTETFKIVETEMKELTDNKDETVKFLRKEKECFQLKNLSSQIALFNIRKDVEKARKDKAKILEEEQTINEKLQALLEQNKHVLDRRRNIQDAKAALDKQLKDLKIEFDEYSEQYKKKQDELKGLLKEKAELEQQNDKIDEKLSRMIDNEGETMNEIETIKTSLNGMEAKKIKAREQVENLEAKYAKEIREINLQKNKVDREALDLTNKISELEQLISSELGDKETAENSLNDNIAFRDRCQTDIREKEVALESHNKNIANLSRTEATITENIEKTRVEQKEISHKLRQLESEKNSLEHRRVEKRGLEDQNTKADRVYNELLNAQATGKLRGIRGKAGELLIIDKEYDKPASTAGRTSLTRIVVDRFSDAQLALNYLRQNRIGQASFIALDKIPNFSEEISARFIAPDNTKRLFDLVSFKSDNLKDLAFFVFKDTLWAPNLTVANNVAFGSPNRRRVVTKDGDLIEPSGLFSGNNPAHGLISLTDRSRNSQEESIDSLNERYNRLNDECIRLNKQKYDISRDLDRLDNDLRFVKSQVDNIRVEQKVLVSDVEELRGKLEATEKEIEVAKKKLRALENSSGEYKRITQEVATLKPRLIAVERERAVWIEKFRKIGGDDLANKRAMLEQLEKEDKDSQERLRQSEAKLKNAKTQQNKIKEQRIEMEKEKKHINSEIDKIKIAKDNIEKISSDNYAKQNEITEKISETDQQLDMLSGELGEFNKFIKNLRAEAQNIKNKAYEKETDINELKNRYKEKKHVQTAVRKDYENILLGYDFIKALKDIGALDENYDMAEAEAIEDENSKRRSIGLIDWKKYLTVDVFADYKQEDINFMADKSKEIDHRLGITENEKNSINPKLSDISVFVRRYNDFKEKEADMNNIKHTTEEIREKLDTLKEKRKREFLAGFNIIAKKLKETYQLLTKGGDAELEPIDCADPFSEGILFSVRPPQKSWKQMSKLSGGEKTLSSLSLVYALHYFKPNPIYFMDEIDAALDYKNVAIVAKYTKEKTKNAQFIVISLRNNMYEQADKLIGIYKTHDTTKTVILEPAKMLESIAVIGRLDIEEERVDRISA